LKNVRKTLILAAITGTLVAVAEGTVTSVPVIAARMSVLRTFFKFLPFAVRARQSRPTAVGRRLDWCSKVLWDVPSRSGTQRRALDLPGGVEPRAARRLCRPQPRSHAGP
ncbi:Mycobacterium terramassiliense ORFan, partial [Mycobacterium terramassiliense]